MVRRISNPHISPELILHSYHQGLVPMANEVGEIGFYAYEPRGIVPLGPEFTIRRSLRQVLKRNDFEVTFDTAVADVLNHCSRHGKIPNYELWLSNELIYHYLDLYDKGYVHSVEVWQGEGEHRTLIGGLYGLTFGAVFCGESMFSLAPYGSQIALVHLVEHLRNRGFEILDAQMPSDHLKQFGLYECNGEQYMKMFRTASEKNVTF